MNKSRQASLSRQGKWSHSFSKMSLNNDNVFGNDSMYKPSNCFRIGTNNVGTLADTADDNDVNNQKLRHLIEDFQLDGILLQELNLYWGKITPENQLFTRLRVFYGRLLMIN